MKISTGYVPRALQRELHATKRRFNVWVIHRRGGKTVGLVNEIIDSAVGNMLFNPQYAYIAPYFSQVKRIAWEYMKQFTKMIPGVTYNESELRVTIPRAKRGDKITIYLLGADNPDAIRGIYLDGAVLDEYSIMSPDVWGTIILPTLTDRRGWAIFAGTPKGRNHFYEILQVAKENRTGEWGYKVAKASETGIIPEADLASARAVMMESEYEQEFECSFSAALIGAYYGKEMEQAERDGRITSVPYEPSVLVDTSWDLGINDTTAIWFFQQVGREIRAIDYIEDAGRGLQYYAELLRKRGYSYGDHYMPHDVEARDLSTGRSRQETFRELGVSPIRIVPRMSFEDWINSSRLLIPKVWFDAKRCERGINALKSYERKWDAKNQIYQSAPLHNWASHGADAWRHYAVGFRDPIQRSRVQNLPRQSDSRYNIFE